MRTVLLSAIAVQLLAIGTFSAALLLVAQPLAVLAVGLQAAALGGAYSVDGVSYAKFFGRDALGSITGVTKACWQVATAVGPTPLALVRDYTGSFLPALGGATVLCLVSFVVVFLFAKRPSADNPQMLPCFRRQSTRMYDKIGSEDAEDEDSEGSRLLKEGSGAEGEGMALVGSSGARAATARREDEGDAPSPADTHFPRSQPPPKGDD